MPQPWAALLLSLVPVIAFLVALRALDTYRLLSLKRVMMAVAAGAVAAMLSYWINGAGFARWGPEYAYAGAPAVEELAKAAYVFFCIAATRVGFPVDAAVIGFAV